jgi:hypothetical protein
LGQYGFGMSSRWDLSVLCVAVAAALPVMAEPAPLPLPSEQLQTYSSNNLEHLLGPLNNGELPRAELARLEIEYKARLAVASPKDKAELQSAVDICTAFDRIMDERQQLAEQLFGGNARNFNSEGSTRRHGDKRAEIRSGVNNTNFIATASTEAANKQWKERGNLWRTSMTQLLLRERQAELVATAAPIASVTPPAPAVPAAPAVEAADPVVGEWWTESHNAIELNPDHTLSGGRHGTWICTSTTEGARTYQLYFPPPKNWTDYLTLSADGKSLTGKTRGHADIGYYRP